MATLEKPKLKQKKKKTRLKSEDEPSFVIERGEDEEIAEELFHEVEEEASSSNVKDPKVAESVPDAEEKTLSDESKSDSAQFDFPAQRIKIPVSLDNKLEIGTEIEVDVQKESCSVSLLEKATQSCIEVSKAAANLKQPITLIEDSFVTNVSAESSKTETASTSKTHTRTYSELSSKMKQIEIAKSSQAQVSPFTFQEIESLFGIKELLAARRYSSEFEAHEMQAPVPTHPLYEALTEYQRARSQQIYNQKEVISLTAECADKQNTIWMVKSCAKKVGSRCADGCYFDSSHSYQDATLQKSLFTEFQRSLTLLREKATEIHSLHSHNEHLHKIQVEQIIWMSTVNGSDSIKDSLRILFWVLRTSGWGYDRELRRQLRSWCSNLATALLQLNNSLENILFILHHVLRVTQGIRWSFHLIKCTVESANDIPKALSLFEAIISHTAISPDSKDKTLDKPLPILEEQDTGDTEVVVAAEATDDSLWLVVDSDGEGADVEAGGAGGGAGVLRENDVLGLVRQIPFQAIFKELMVIRSDGEELIFCGGKLNGGPVLRVFASVRVLLAIIRTGLMCHKQYQELSKELCRLALHSVKYCTELWELASPNCEANLLERVISEYNSVFMAGWSTLECAGSRDVSLMFLSEMPFGLVKIETAKSLYSRTRFNLIVSDSVWCYYALVCISNMAITRTEEDFAMTIIKNLFLIGYRSDFSELGCGEWARTLCGSALRSKPQLLGPLLLISAPPASPAWLVALPLALWRPPAQELVRLLDHWLLVAPHLIRVLIKEMDWTQKGGLDLQTHRSVGIFLATMSQNLITPKYHFPEWIWECVLPLKLHCFDWGIDKSWAIQAESVPGLDLSGKCPISSIVGVLATSLGHSVPQIFLQAVPLLVKLATAGRFAEVVHALHYILPILVECPDAIGQCKNFKELLTIMIRNEKSYAKMATRFVIGDYSGPVIKLLVTMMQAQLKHFKMFALQSVRPLLMVWVNWLTSSEGWQGDWIVIHLLDVALGCCFLHHEAISEAASFLGSFIQSPTNPRSPTSGSGFSWLWSPNSSYRGLVQCSVEAGYLWHATLWTEHSVMERFTGLWPRLLDRLAQHREGTKVNIDKAVKSIGGSDNSGALVIYRCLQYATSLSLTHPIYPLIWQLFFYLYLDINCLSSQSPKLLGPLFFEGLVNSRLLAKAKARLIEAENYHKAKSIELCDDPSGFRSRTNERQWYHECQTQLMKAFHAWLDDDIYMNLSDERRNLRTFNDKFNMLLAGQNTAWIEMVDHFQLNAFQPPAWPTSLLQDLGWIQPVPSRGKTPETSPGDRILLRVRTYEAPILDSAEYGKKNRLEPLLDPTMTRDFNKVHKLMNDHLKFLEKCAQKYDNNSRNLSSIDGNLCDLIPALYEKREFCKRVKRQCGEKCLGKAEIVVSGEESKLMDSVKVKIGYNRNMHKTALEKAMKSFDDVAAHTAVISKLAQLAYDGHISNLGDKGVMLFNTVLAAIKEENTQFPPANQILVNVATQLGEKFVTNSGIHCVQLVGKAKGAESIGLVGTLLRPSQLPTSEMIRVYSAISTQVQNTHVAFSYLSKFHISGWLHDVRPSVAERSRFLTLLCEGLGAAGCNPPQERLMLHELMCIHMSKVLAWEFPVHLGQVLATLCTLSLERKLPPDTWQHCINIIETYPHLLSHQQARESMELVGRQWWSKRGAWGPHGLYSSYSAYAAQMGRLGALLASTVLSTAMLHSPPLLTKHICSVVMAAMRTFWDVWLCPWWGGASQVSPWVDDLARGPCLMPWGPEDNVGPQGMVEALVETLLYCCATLPGSLTDLLGLTWQWYAHNFPHPAVAAHVFSRIHPALAKLPWTAYPEHWLTFADLQTIAKVTNLNLAPCNTFMLQCLGSRRWRLWLDSQPPPFHPPAVQMLLPILLKLQFDEEVLDDAMDLPWQFLSVEMYEETVGWFMATNNSSSKIFHSNRLVPLLCAVGGLVPGGEISPDWRNKRTCLIRAWVGATASTSCSGVADSIRDLLNRIQDTVMSLENISTDQKVAEGTILISSAVLMLNMMVLLEVAQEEWTKWINNTTKICLMSLISCLLQVTQRDAFAKLSEQALLAFFEQEGEWTFVINSWQDNCIVPVDYLIGNSVLLTAMATYKATDRTRFQGNAFSQLDKGVLQSLHGLEPECSNERQSSLWVCYMMSLMGDTSLDRGNCLAVINQVALILDKWSQEPAWGLLKAMRLVQNKAPSHKFRIITKYALCLTLTHQQKIKESSPPHSSDPNPYLKNVAALEGMIDQKPYADNRLTLMNCLDFLKDRNNCIQDSLKTILELCAELYTDVNYLLNMNELFKM